MPLANVDSPFGFRLVFSSGTREPRRIQRVVPASRSLSIMIGDSYTLDSSGQALRAVGTEASASAVRGIVEGIALNPIAASPNGPVSQDYLPAADAGAIIGIEDNNAEFRAQITTIAVTDVGKRCQVVNNTNDVTLRQSRQELDGATLSASDDDEFVVVSLLDSPADNAYGANAKVVVRMRHCLS